MTDHLKNWEDVEISAKRKDLGGVVRSFSNKFEFVKGAYDLLEAEYLSNYTKASAILVIGVLNDSWGYNEKFRCKLDFSTYQSDGYTISINAIDDSVASIINANKSQVYDIPVSELKEDTLYYDRMNLNNRVEFGVNPNDPKNEQTDPDIYPIEYTGNYLFPLIYMDTNFPVKNKIEVFDNDGYVENSNDVTPLIKAISDIKIVFRLDFKIRQVEVGVDQQAIYPELLLWLFDKNGVRQTSTKIGYFDGDNDIHIDYQYTVLMRPGDYISLFIDSKTLQTLHAKVFDVKEISVSYIGRNKPVNIDVFSPKKLLSSLLSRMGVSLSGDIVSGSMPIPWMMAAESVRGIKDAKVHTSFSKFCDFAKALLGYDYEILDNSVRFRHMNDFFVNETKELDHVSNMELSVDESLIYSGIEIGFDKQDYDEINGRDEFHFKSSFSTGLDIKDNILSLISPYRADCYGLEFLANERDEESKDTDSDNDIFIAHARKDGDRLVLVREENGGAIYAVTGVLFPDTIFNASYSPRNMLLVNKDRLGICTDYLSFTASDGNSSISIGGVSETLPISLPVNDRRIRIDKVSLETPGLSPFPGNYRGRLSFSCAGRSYEGWVSEITEKIGKYQTASYSLILSKIT